MDDLVNIGNAVASAKMLLQRTRASSARRLRHLPLRRSEMLRNDGKSVRDSIAASHSALSAQLMLAVESTLGRIDDLHDAMSDRNQDSWIAAQQRHETVLTQIRDLDAELARIRASVDQISAAAQMRHETILDRLASIDRTQSVSSEHSHQILGRLNSIDQQVLRTNDQLIVDLHSDNWNASELRHKSVLESLDALADAVAVSFQRIGRAHPAFATTTTPDPQPVGDNDTSSDTAFAIPVVPRTKKRATPDLYIVSASNDNFLPLAKGMWKSLMDLRLDQEFGLAWIDIGSSDRTREWLSSEMPQVRQIQILPIVHEFISRLSDQGYHSALLIRPFLPDLIPEASGIIWIDSDMWIQDASSVRAFRDAISFSPESTAISPILDIAYTPLFGIARVFSEGNIARVWNELYGPEIAEEFVVRPLLSAGIFAMSSTNPLWHDWEGEIERLWTSKDKTSPEVLHVAEQTALNFLLYSSGRYSLVDPLCNFHANLGALERDEVGIVSTTLPNRRKIGIVHLSDIVSRRLARDYLTRGLLYRSGDYLDEAEVAHLLSFDRE